MRSPGTIDTLSKSENSNSLSVSMWLTFAICFLSNVSAGLISTLMSVYLPTVVNALSANKGEDLNIISSYINALYIGGWAVGGFMWGYISDSIGRVKALALSAGAFGLFTVLISTASSWEAVVAFRMLSGFSVGGILVITPTLLYETWPERLRSVIIGVDSIGFPVGIFSSGLINYLVNDWRQAFFVGFVPLTIAFLSVMIVKESSDWKKIGTAKPKATEFDKTNLLKGTIVFGSMLIGLWGMFSWIPTWVQSLLDNLEGQSQRGITMMLLGVGGLSGGFISGWISNALGVRRAMLLCFCGCILMSFLLFGFNREFSSVIYAELAVLSLFFGISQGLLSIYIPQLFPVHVRGTFTGVCFNVGRIFTALAIFFVGVLVTVLGGYGNALLAFAGIFIAGFITIYLTKEHTTKTIS